LPTIRKELEGALDENDNLARLILRLYDEYAHDIKRHMQYEEKKVFPYVESLERGEPTLDYDMTPSPSITARPTCGCAS
jgi:regulator of cell morphogenesis and NO signaling